MTQFRYVTATDVDRFVSLFPTDVLVDMTNGGSLGLAASGIVVTGPALTTWDCACDNDDYAIFCDVPKHVFFDLSGMRWLFAFQCSCDPSSSVLQVVDAGAGAKTLVPLAPLVDYLTLRDTSTLGHMRQCQQFFRYSFRIGDGAMATLVDGGAPVRGQLYGVYLCRLTGAALPYAELVPRSRVFPVPQEPPPAATDDECCGHDFVPHHLAHLCHGQGHRHRHGREFSMVRAEATEPQVPLIYYADLPPTDPSGGRLYELPRVNGVTLQVACPPHPEHPDSGPLAVAHVLSASGLVTDLVQVLDLDPSGTEALDPRQVVHYGTSQDARALFLYYILEDGRLYAAYRSHAVLPTRDMSRACGYVPWAYNPCVVDTSCNAVATDADHFSLEYGAALDPGKYHWLGVGAEPSVPACPRMKFPLSGITVTDGLGMGQQTSGAYPQMTYQIPFRFEDANQVGLVGPVSLGTRFMQLVSVYMFDGCTPKELSYFPRFQDESTALVRVLADAVATHFQTSNDIRDSVLRQLAKKYGLGVFDEAAAPQFGAYGKVSDVLRSIGDLLLVFTVTLIFVMKTSDANAAFEKFAVRKVPVVLRLS